MLRFLIYAVMFGSWAYTLVYDVLWIPVLYGASWFSKFVFLTQLNFLLQTIYFGLSCVRALIDDLKSKSRSKRDGRVPSYYTRTKLHTVCDFIYATSAFPVGMATCVLFWSLWSIDREMVFPRVLDDFIPSWHNHMLHTSPVVFLIVDTCCTCHHMPCRKTGTLVVLALTAIYFAVLIGVRVIRGHWLYGVFDALSLNGQALFLAVAAAAFWFLYIMGDSLNRAIWGTPSHMEAKAEVQSPEKSSLRQKVRRD